MEKKQRSACLYKFTRNYNLLIEAINAVSPESVVTPQFEKLKECWSKLEEAHDNFITATDIDIENDAGGAAYIDAPGKNYQNAVKRYSEFFKGAKQL